MSPETIAPQPSPARPSETTVTPFVQNKTPQMLASYDLVEESLNDMQGLSLVQEPPQKVEATTTDRRNILRLLGASTLLAATTLTSRELLWLLDEPMRLPEPTRHITPELFENEGIAGLEDASFTRKGNIYFSRSGIQDKINGTDGMIGWQTLGSAQNHELFLNTHTGQDIYTGIDLVAIDGKEFFRMSTAPDKSIVKIQCFEDGNWLSPQEIPQAYRPPYQNPVDGRRIDWQDPSVKDEAVELLQEDLLEMSYFFPYGRVPDIKVVAPSLTGEIVKIPNYPSGTPTSESNALIFNCEEMIPGAHTWEVGLFKGIASSFLQNIDVMMYQNNLSSYHPKTVAYVWSNIEEQLNNSSSLPRPEWWPDKKPYSLFDSTFHPGAHEGRLATMDFPATLDNALASMLYVSRNKELAKAVGKKFTNLQKPELTIQQNDIYDWSYDEEERWGQAIRFSQTEQGALAYLSHALTNLIQHGTPRECSLDFSLVKTLFNDKVDITLTRFDPWSKGLHAPLMTDTVESLYGTYKKWLSPQAIEAIEQTQAMTARIQ